MAAEPAARHEVEEVLAQPGDRDVGLDPGAGVEQLGVDDLADRDVQVGPRDPLHQVERARAGDLELRERALVDHADRRAHRRMLGGDVLEGVAAPERRLLDRVDPLGGEPVGALPPELGAQHRAGTDQCVVERAAPLTARAGQLAIGVGDVVVVLVGVDRASLQIGRHVVRRAEPADVERPQVQTGVAVDDPVGHREASATGGRDPGREAAAVIEVVQVLGDAHQRLGVGGEGDRTVDPALDTDLGEERNPLSRSLSERFEPFVVRARRAPGRGHGGCVARAHACRPPSRRGRARRSPA